MNQLPERPSAAPDLLVEADVRNAARSLLRTPLLHSDRQSDDFGLVRRHQGDLVRFFADGLGYRLVVEPGLARLYKTGLGTDSSRGLRRRNDALFTPRRYAFLALTLAALTQSRRQVMVDELVAGVRSAAVDAGIDVDLDAIGERRALHSALVALVDLGCSVSVTATSSIGRNAVPSPCSTSTATASRRSSPLRSGCVSGPRTCSR
jgi:uncharacterized protein (TIGR02678 family)